MHRARTSTPEHSQPAPEHSKPGLSVPEHTELADSGEVESQPACTGPKSVAPEQHIATVRRGRYMSI